jgi:glyoxylase-like metal-dependent hydrolase (beta-lactamase superfamily II)
MIRLVYSAPQPASPKPPTPAAPEAFRGLSIFERGWLSANNVLLHGQGEGAVLVDSGHALHAAQTVALVRGDLQDGEALRCVINTHLHSDHCGGNAALQREFQVPTFIPPGGFEAVRQWDEAALSYRPTGQHCERFDVHGTVQPGERLALGLRSWDVLAAAGHDPDAVMLFDREHRVLISGDALWENGFGVVFPELDGQAGFDDVAAVLDRIEGLSVQWVIPGHGAPFCDVASALQRARSRLAGFRADPAKHARHAAKVLLKFHLLEVQSQSVAAMHLWAGETPLVRQIWEGQGRPEASLHLWCDGLIRELVRSAAVISRNGQLSNP